MPYDPLLRWETEGGALAAEEEPRPAPAHGEPEQGEQDAGRRRDDDRVVAAPARPK